MGDFLQTAVFVDIEAVTRNMGVVRRLIGSDTKLMSVVKADGYGLGIISMAKTTLSAGADWLGVATLSEGASLRKAGIDAPVLVFCPVLSDYEREHIILGGLSTTVFNLEGATKLSEMSVRLGKPAKIHIKVDTGLNRIGYALGDMDRVADEITVLAGLPGVELEGIYSHLATSSTDPGFVGEQLALFNQINQKLAGRGIFIPLRSISNSGAVLNHPECNLDMVRCGVLTYGLSPCSTPKGVARMESLGFVQAFSFKARVNNIKTIRAGESVGYGRNFFASRETLVATISVGYADGLSRQLSNKGRVLINGCFCDIIGNVCMDQSMVDATGVSVKIGDEVVIIGRSGSQRILAEDIALTQDTINYEVATSLALRAPRCYI